MPFHLLERNQSIIKIIRNIADSWAKIVQGMMSEKYLESIRTSRMKLFSKIS